MNKKIIIGLGAAIVLIGVGFYLYWNTKIIKNSPNDLRMNLPLSTGSDFNDPCSNDNDCMRVCDGCASIKMNAVRDVVCMKETVWGENDTCKCVQGICQRINGNNSETNSKTCYKEGEGGQGLPAAGMEIFCCQGLSVIDDSSCGDTQCTTILWKEGFICAKCGDGVCGKGENKVNCPKDCGAAGSDSGGKPMAEGFKLSEGNFNFIFQYGMCNEPGYCDGLNTLTGVYTKNMCGDPDVKTEMKLSKEEMASIYNKLKDLNLLGDFDHGANYQTFVTPSKNFYFTAKNGTDEKTISWNEYTGAAAYQAFGNFLVNLIESKPEFKKLPVPVCGYL